VSLPQASAPLPPNPGPSPQDDLSALKTLFLTTLNHEIRTPLSGVIGMTDLLLETNLDDEQREYAATARQCAEDLLNVLNATLQYAALQAGQVTIDESEFNLRELTEGLVVAYAPKARAKNLRLFSTLESGLASTLLGDGQRIKEVLGYLLDNAIKFTHHGRVELTVSYSDGRLKFAVCDTGIGIAPHQRDQIFASFRQGDEGLKREYRGAGLGLTLAEKLVHLMHGSLRFESEVSQGTTFTMEIPARLPESNTPAVAAASCTPATRLPLVLAVEDNPVGAAVIRHALKHRPLELHTAASGAEAKAAAAQHHYDVILMDLQMPDMNGIEATAAIRELAGYDRVPILALTADVSEDLRRECYQSGMQGFLTKPIDSEQLWTSIRSHLKLDPQTPNAPVL